MCGEVTSAQVGRRAVASRSGFLSENSSLTLSKKARDLKHQKPLAFLLTATLLAGCASNVQPVVTQFGVSVATVATAEREYIAAINQKQVDAQTMVLLASNHVEMRPDRSVMPPGSTPDSSTVPQQVTDAISQILDAIKAYGDAMQALSNDPAAATFDINIDLLAANAVKLDASLLTNLKAKGLPTDAEINAVAAAVKDIGNIVITALISRDVKAAAARAQDPLTVVGKSLRKVNAFWAKNTPENLSFDTIQAAVRYWNSAHPPLSYSDRVAVKAIWDKAAQPLTPRAADNALETLVRTNDQVATAGPVAARAQIDALAKAAADALNAYKAFR